MKHSLIVVSATIFSIFLGLAKAQNSHIPTINELMNIRSLGAAALSPDGQYVAYEIQRADYEADSHTQELLVAEVPSGKSVPVPSLKGVPGNFEWSPDGQWLAFVEHPKKGVGQIWAIPAKGGVARQVSDSANDVGLFHWSPDSREIAYLTAPQDSVLSERTEKYGSFEVVGKDYPQMQLYVCWTSVQVHNKWIFLVRFDGERAV